jgi:exopolysaccharide biosynthesis protein
MTETRGSSLFWFLVGIIVGGGLVFFLATKEGKRIMAKLNLDSQEIEKIRRFLENVAEGERVEVLTSNGKAVDKESEIGEVKELQEQKRLFGHRFFKKKKTS